MGYCGFAIIKANICGIYLQRLNQNNVSTPGQNVATEELQLMRTILERLECSFASQEAKLDSLLHIMTAVPPTVPQTPQCLPWASIQPPTVSTPYSLPSNSSVEFPPLTARPQEMERADAPAPRTVLREVERLTDNANVIGKQ